MQWSASSLPVTGLIDLSGGSVNYIFGRAPRTGSLHSGNCLPRRREANCGQAVLRHSAAEGNYHSVTFFVCLFSSCSPRICTYACMYFFEYICLHYDRPGTRRRSHEHSEEKIRWKERVHSSDEHPSGLVSHFLQTSGSRGAADALSEWPKYNAIDSKICSVGVNSTGRLRRRWCWSRRRMRGTRRRKR